MTTARFKALIFDLDGTLTRPSLDFDAICREIGCAPRGDLMDQIAALPASDREQAWSVIRRHEAEAMAGQELQPGVEEVLERCRRDGMKVGVITRNERLSVDHLAGRFGLKFDAVVDREFPFVKPHPAPVRHLLKQWDLNPRDALMVGDYRHDIDSGRAAGVATCFFQNPGLPDYGRKADYTVHSMRELTKLVWEIRG